MPDTDYVGFNVYSTEQWHTHTPNEQNRLKNLWLQSIREELDLYLTDQLTGGDLLEHADFIEAGSSKLNERLKEYAGKDDRALRAIEVIKALQGDSQALKTVTKRADCSFESVLLHCKEYLQALGIIKLVQGDYVTAQSTFETLLDMPIVNEEFSLAISRQLYKSYFYAGQTARARRHFGETTLALNATNIDAVAKATAMLDWVEFLLVHHDSLIYATIRSTGIPVRIAGDNNARSYSSPGTRIVRRCCKGIPNAASPHKSIQNTLDKTALSSKETRMDLLLRLVDLSFSYAIRKSAMPGYSTRTLLKLMRTVEETYVSSPAKADQKAAAILRIADTLTLLGRFSKAKTIYLGTHLLTSHQGLRESFDKVMLLSPLTTRTIYMGQRPKNEPPEPRQVTLGFDLTAAGEIQALEVLASTGNNIEVREAKKRLNRMAFRPQLERLKFVGSEGLKITFSFRYSNDIYLTQP